MKRLMQAESRLLLFNALFLLCGFLLLSLYWPDGKAKLPQLLGIAAAVSGAFFLSQRLLRFWEALYLIFPAFLCSMGLILLGRLKPALVTSQAVWIGCGLAAFFLARYSFQKIHIWKRYKYTCGLIGLVLLVSAVIFGVDINGHRSWVVLGPIRFQPAEFARLFLIIFFAAYLSERRELLCQNFVRIGPFRLPRGRFIAPVLCVWLMSMLVLVVERDLGSALLYYSIALVMLYWASGKWDWLVVGFALFLLGSVASYAFYGHIQTRVDIWLDPWVDATGRGYQIVQSLFALGWGHILGTGLFLGYPAMIPEVHTDFIFAAIGEEWGLVGAGGVLCVYLLLIFRAFWTVRGSREPFVLLLGGGLAFNMAIQVLLILAGVIKAFPLTGITLPFLSYGGSSMVSNFLLLGILAALSERSGNHDE